MAGSFSGHLVDSFMSTHQPRGPFGCQPQPQIATHGPLAYAPQMHGSFTQQSFAPFSEPSFMDLSEETARRIATLQAKLNKKLGPEYISQRPGPSGGPKLTYAEGWKIINLANEVFGFNGWSSSVVSMTTDFIDFNEDTKRYSIGVTAIVRVMLRDGVFHEDIGYGMLENSKSKGGALDKCKKEAVTDGIKRSLRNFGNLLGNCLYDKQYAQEVVKIKVPPPKFDKDELHRRPEFDPARLASSTHVNLPTKPPSATSAGPSNIKSEPNTNSVTPQQPKQLSSIPPHLRAISGPAAASTPNAKGKSPDVEVKRTPNISAPAIKTGLNTPITPFHIQKQEENHQINSSLMSHQPEQQHQPPAAQSSDKHVSFAVPKAPVASVYSADLSYDDESFGLNSEDDAFLAAIDLGEGDSGIGGPIDFDEGNGGITLDAGSVDAGRDADRYEPAAPAPAQQPPKPLSPKPQFRPPQNQAEQQQQKPPQQQQYKPPQQQQQQSPHPQQHQQQRPQPLQQQQQPQRKHQPPQQQQQPQRQPLQPRAQPSGVYTHTRKEPSPDQKSLAANDSSSSSGTRDSAGERSLTPSMGGFHFPPGVNPQTLGKSGPSVAPNNNSRTTGGQPSNPSSIGLKRSADMMHAQPVPSAQGRRPHQGMGLASHSGSGNGSGTGAAAGQQSWSNGRREPLAALDVADGGDLKRVKR